VRLGLAAAASLALHTAVLGGLGADESGAAVRERSAQGMLVRLAGQPDAASPAPSPAPATRARPAAAKYLSSSEVDERATPIEMATLVYPERAYVNRIAGKVRLRIYISADGRIDKADIVAAAPAGHFEQAAIDAVQRTRFHPARRAGRPVPSQKLIEVEFDPYGPVPEERP
jgi:TonB family protein